MKLEEYLQCLRECPDEFLEGTEFELIDLNCGLTDNWIMLFKTDLPNFLKIMTDSGKFRRNTDEQFFHLEEEGVRHVLEYIPGSVIINVAHHNHETIFPYKDWKNRTNEELEHHKRQTRDYNLITAMNAYHKKRLVDAQGNEINASRAMTLAIDDLGQVILKNNIPACFPLTRPRRYIPNTTGSQQHDYLQIIGDCSSIVYYP